MALESNRDEHAEFSGSLICQFSSTDGYVLQMNKLQKEI